MASLFMTHSVKDVTIRKVIDETEISYSARSDLSQQIKSSDGTVSISLVPFTSVNAVFIKSEGSITVTINGTAISLNNFLFMTVDDLTSLTVECSDVDGYLVDIIVWGE